LNPGQPAFDPPSTVFTHPITTKTKPAASTDKISFVFIETYANTIARSVKPQSRNFAGARGSTLCPLNSP
jgi:hypothetical protein